MIDYSVFPEVYPGILGGYWDGNVFNFPSSNLFGQPEPEPEQVVPKQTSPMMQAGLLSDPRIIGLAGGRSGNAVSRNPTGGLIGQMSNALQAQSLLDSPISMAAAMAAPVPGFTIGLLGARSLADKNVRDAFSRYSRAMNEKEGFAPDRGFNSRTGTTASSRAAERSRNLGQRAGGRTGSTSSSRAAERSRNLGQRAGGAGSSASAGRGSGADPGAQGARGL